uniref:37 kDa salivary gland allergen Aed a 2 n=1 Tax=Zeugodacus cucurbitae TaxID=28588 RepID=A0A0A1XQI6_ZEUCU
MNALIFIYISYIFLNLNNIALALYIINKDLKDDRALGEEREYKTTSPFDGAEVLQLFPGLMPEEVRYAKHRCSHELPKANVNWGAQIFSNEAEVRDTQCYVKCFLRRVGLIRLDTLGWDFYRVGAMFYNIIQRNQSFPENCLAALVMADDEMNGECEPYYNTWIKLFQNCRLAFNYFFYYDVELEELAFEKPLPLYREPGIEPFQFCSAVLRAETIDMESPDFAFCIYLQLHYFDSYGRIDTSEIIHSFAGSDRLTAFNENVIKSCAHLANAHYINGQNTKEMAQQMTTCLTKNASEDYSFVLQYWNQVMRDY